jgi:hypothetical protein
MNSFRMYRCWLVDAFCRSLLRIFACCGVAATVHAQTWTLTKTNLPGVNQAYSIAYGNGRFVATFSGNGANTPGVGWSIDGQTWNASSPGLSFQQGSLAFFGGMFRLASNAGVWRSADGNTWQRIYSATNSNTFFRGIATDGHGMLLGNANTNGNTLVYTPDEVTWRSTAPLPNTGAAGTSSSVQGVVYGAGRYLVTYAIHLANGNLVTYAASTIDGTSWTLVPALASAYQIAGGNGRIVGMSGLQVSVSTDGTTFSTTTLPLEYLNPGLMGFAGGRFFLMEKLAGSFDGVTWTSLGSITWPSSRNISEVAYGNGRYVVVGFSSSSGVPSDVIAWGLALAPPILATQPASQTVIEGKPATLGITVDNPDTGTTFQWRHDGKAISGATAATLAFDAIKSSDAGSYACDVKNTLGSASSEAAILAVVPITQAGRITNLSVLTAVTQPDESFAVGFVLGGNGTSGTTSLLVRAGGPSLSQFGVGSPNPDPKLELISGGVKIAENDNWGGTAQLLAAATQVGAYAYPALDSTDAALISDRMAVGGSTVQISANNGATGAVIAELYDATTSNSFTATTPRLINVSVRKALAPGATLIAGFAIGGLTSKTVLVRAIGPSLAAYGVSGAHPNPTLALYPNGATTPSMTNDDWGGGVELRNAFAAVGAFALDASTRDAAFIATLPPGTYSAQASGVGTTSGVVLVEVYEIP